MTGGRRAPIEGRVDPPIPTTADFHAHTARSDGLLLPAELAAAAAAAGVRTLAVTDHDTLAGFRELAAPGAPHLPPGLELIPGVEINATTDDRAGLQDGELHMVGLGVDPAADALEALLDRQRRARRRRFELMIERLREIDMPIEAELEGLHRDDDESLGRPTIARALVAAGFATDVPDAFDRIVGNGKPGYIRRIGMSPLEALAAIRGARGLPILAHFSAAPRLPALLDELVAAGLAGIEVHHRSFDAATVDAMRAVAVRHGLLPSGGTDFHGDDGSYAEAVAETWIPDEVAAGVMARLGRRAAAAEAPA